MPKMVFNVGHSKKDGAVYDGVEVGGWVQFIFATMDDLAIFTDKGLKWLDICLSCNEFV